MTEAKHTPGPWQSDSKRGPHNVEGTVSSLGVYSVSKAQDLVEEYDGDEEEAVENSWVCGIWGKVDGEDEANAYLIAAAPDLLSALKQIVNSIEVHDDRAVNMALAAISKAEGRQ